MAGISDAVTLLLQHLGCPPKAADLEPSSDCLSRESQSYRSTCCFHGSTNSNSSMSGKRVTGNRVRHQSSLVNLDNCTNHEFTRAVSAEDSAACKAITGSPPRSSTVRDDGKMSYSSKANALDQPFRTQKDLMQVRSSPRGGATVAAGIRHTCEIIFDSSVSKVMSDPAPALRIPAVDDGESSSKGDGGQNEAESIECGMDSCCRSVAPGRAEQTETSDQVCEEAVSHSLIAAARLS